MSTAVLKRANHWLRIQLLSESAYLIPLRLFIGIGWIRAGLEKFMDPGWPRGTTLVEFFNQHLSSGSVVFPFYRQLVHSIFTPNAAGLSWLIMLGQILVGIAILTGAFTNFALLCGMVMNLNFILIGEVTPSAFYMVIQILLLVTNVGYPLGVDALLARKIPSGLFVAQPYAIRKFWRFERSIFLGLALAMPFLALASIPYIRDYSPHSVDDPAMILLVLSVIAGLSAWITAIKFPRPVRLVGHPVIAPRSITRPRQRNAQ